MTTVQAEDGSTIETDLPAEAVADLQKPEEKPAEAPAAEPQTPPAEPKTEEPKTEPAKEPEKEPEGQQPTEVDRKPKATPFQTLLEKKHEAEERAEKAEKALQEHLAKVAEHPASETPADIKALAEKYELKEEFVADMIAMARNGFKPELPKEVSDLIAKRQAEEQQKAEEAAFAADYGRLEGTLQSDKDILAKPEVQKALKDLAYSTEKAPDGEPYFKKPLFELFMKFVKPEHEPGRVTVEENRGGNKNGQEVLDFEAIHNDDAALDKFAKEATSAQWADYVKWRDAKQGDVPIIRQR